MFGPTSDRDVRAIIQKVLRCTSTVSSSLAGHWARCMAVCSRANTSGHTGTHRNTPQPCMRAGCDIKSAAAKGIEALWQLRAHCLGNHIVHKQWGVTQYNLCRYASIPVVTNEHKRVAGHFACGVTRVFVSCLEPMSKRQLPLRFRKRHAPGGTISLYVRLLLVNTGSWSCLMHAGSRRAWSFPRQRCMDVAVITPGRSPRSS